MHDLPSSWDRYWGHYIEIQAKDIIDKVGGRDELNAVVGAQAICVARWEVVQVVAHDELRP
jgi:hypothetical protein